MFILVVNLTLISPKLYIKITRKKLLKKLLIRKSIMECLKMGNGATARMHFDFWSDFAINFLQNLE